jgi:putative DNA primase/helicase
MPLTTGLPPVSDGAGLVVLIKPNGSKLWRYRYSINGKKQKLSLGTYPEVSLSQARVTADEILIAVESSIIVEMSSNEIGTSRDKEAVNTLWDFLTANTTSMGAVAREGNKANVQRGGSESLGWLDLVETQNHEEYEPVFYLNKKQLNTIAKNECGMTGADMLALLDKYGYHETPDTVRGRKDGTIKRRVRAGQGIVMADLLKIAEPATTEE